MFVGEGPGEQEDLQGLPFVGGRASSWTGWSWKRWASLGRTSISPIPSSAARQATATPSPTRSSHAGPTSKTLELVNPRVVVTLGNFATKLLLATTEGISRLRGRVYPYAVRLTGPYFPPSAALRGGGTSGGPDESRPGAGERGSARRPAAQGAGAPSGRPGPAGPDHLRPNPPFKANFRRPMVQDSGTPSDAGAMPAQVFTDEPSPTGAVVVHTATPEDTKRVGRRWPAFCAPGTRCCWAANSARARPPSRKGWRRRSGVGEPVTSPTFVLVHSYKTAPAGSSCTPMSGGSSSSRRLSTSPSRNCWRKGRRP